MGLAGAGAPRSALAASVAATQGGADVRVMAAGASYHEPHVDGGPAAGKQASGAVFHAFSDDGGTTFSEPARVSDASFPLHAPTPPPAPANQEGTWTGDYLAVTTSRRKVVIAWSDQRAGPRRSAVYVAFGE